MVNKINWMLTTEIQFNYFYNELFHLLKCFV